MSVLWWLLVTVVLAIVVVDWCCLEMARRNDNTEEAPR